MLYSHQISSTLRISTWQSSQNSYQGYFFPWIECLKNRELLRNRKWHMMVQMPILGKICKKFQRTVERFMSLSNFKLFCDIIWVYLFKIGIYGALDKAASETRLYFFENCNLHCMISKPTRSYHSLSHLKWKQLFYL